MLPLISVALSCLALLVGVSGHVEFDPMVAPTDGDDFAFAINVGHGCNGEATTRLDVQIPTNYVEGLVRPQTGEMIGWTGVYFANNNTVAYYATDSAYYVPDAYFFKLGMEVQLTPVNVPSGQVVMATFPTRQTCTNGQYTDWTSSDMSSSTPAPMLHFENASTSSSSSHDGLSIAAIVLSAIAIAAVVCSWIFGFFVRRGMRSLEESEKGNDRV